MARTLTAPQTKLLVNKQTVTDLGYHLEFSAGLLDMERSSVRYRVTSFAGTEPRTFVERAISFAALPPVVKQKLKELHTLAMTDADNNGLLSPGTDADDF